MPVTVVYERIPTDISLPVDLPQIECQHIACTDSLIRQRQGVVKHATCLCGQAHAVGRGFLSQPFEPFRQCWNYLDQR